MSFWGNNETIEQTESGVVVKDVREDAPEWKRCYEKRLDNRAFIKIEARTWLGRNFSGTLTQPNGNYIFFEPERIADKIIDPLLVPLVQACVDEVFALDKAYLKTNPDEFTDDKGVRWKRVA